MSDPVHDKIARYIAEELVENGSVLQLGIGKIPFSVLGMLGNHEELGVHSEMISGEWPAALASAC